VEDFGSVGEDLIDQFWPGGLTLVCRASRSLVWDLGDTKGTVAIRMPLHPVALDLLRRTGPLAVSSANRSGEPSATTAEEAEAQLGEAVAVYLDDGACLANVPSTIVDLTGTVPRLLRAGVVPIERLREVIALAVADAADENASDAETPASGEDMRPPGAETPASAQDTRPPSANGSASSAQAGEGRARPAADEEASGG